MGVPSRIVVGQNRGRATGLGSPAHADVFDHAKSGIELLGAIEIGDIESYTVHGGGGHHLTPPSGDRFFALQHGLVQQAPYWLRRREGPGAACRCCPT